MNKTAEALESLQHGVRKSAEHARKPQPSWLPRTEETRPSQHDLSDPHSDAESETGIDPPLHAHRHDSEDRPTPHEPEALIVGVLSSAHPPPMVSCHGWSIYDHGQGSPNATCPRTAVDLTTPWSRLVDTLEPHAPHNVGAADHEPDNGAIVKYEPDEDGEHAAPTMRDRGYDDGYRSGRQDGHCDGQEYYEGYDSGYRDGYDDGFSTHENEPASASNLLDVSDPGSEPESDGAALHMLSGSDGGSGEGDSDACEPSDSGEGDSDACESSDS